MRREDFDRKLDTVLNRPGARYISLCPDLREFLYSELLPALLPGTGSMEGTRKVCEECGLSYRPVRKGQRFHHKRCKNAWWARERRRILKERKERP